MATASTMPRKSIDCRLYPSEKHCTLKISGTEDEVLQAAIAHAITVHGHSDSPELVDELRELLRDEPDGKPV
jgi:Protein of unknown function (DUF1059)